jgi:hypothetical protein
MIERLLILMALLSCASGIAQTIFGTVEDIVSSEGLIGASITDVEQNYTVLSDAFGRFNLSVGDAASVRVVISYVGYRSLDTTVDVTSRALRLRLATDADLPTVVVKATEGRQAVRNSLTVVDIPVELLNTLPPLAGEVDPIKALQLMPGISAGAEGTADLYIRGGTPDQNLILFDGAKIYNANHLFGFLSPFHPDLLKSVRVHKAGFPARFGGRLSSVVEIDSKEGNKQEWEKSLGLGLINSRFHISGPLKKDKLSVSAGGRTAHLSLLNLLSINQSSFQTYFFYDANVKVNLKTDRSNLSFSSFRNYDRTVAKDDVLRSPIRGIFDYGNLTASLRWAYSLSPATITTLLATVNDYQYSAREIIQSSLGGSTTESRSTISERTIRYDIRTDASTAFSFGIGVEANNRTVKPRQITTDNVLVETDVNATEYSNDVGFYQSNVLRIGRGTKVEAGLRWQAYDLPFGGGWVSFLEPRFNGRQQITNRSWVNVSYAKMSQGLHMVSNNFIGFPTNLWVTANQRTPPSSSFNFALGYTYNTQKGSEAVVEGYYKTGQNIIDPLPGVSFFQSSLESWEDNVSTGGESEAYGVELLYRRNGARIFGWAAYTLSWNRIRYADINGGQWYFRQFDRRHDLSLVGGINLNEKWQFLSTFVFNSGFRLTLPAALYYDGFSNEPIPVYRGRYNEKSPLYHRLDIAFRREVVQASGRKHVFTIGCNNVYGRQNPTILLTQARQSGRVASSRLPGSIRNTVDQFSLFTFIPFANYSITL